MKNILYKLTFVLLFAGLLSSCEKNLDQLPFDEFATDNAFITAQDYENAIRGAYSALTRGGLYGSSDAGSMLSAPDVLADNVTLAQKGRGTKRVLHDYEYNANSTLLGTYQDAYVLIFRANQILFYAENFEGESKANIVAEAKALRALAHFNLVSFFGKIPTQSADAGSSLGVAYVTEASADIEPARMTVSETYNLIVADLIDAQANINPSNDEGRMGESAVNVLLSRVYLYMGSMANAINAANAVSGSVGTRDNL